MHRILMNINKITNTVIALSIILVIISPFVGLVFFAISVGSFELYQFIRTRKPNTTNLKLQLSPGEKNTYSKFHIFFKYPTTAMDSSSALATIQVSSIGMGALLGLRGLYVFAVLVALNYVLAANLAFRLNPRHYYSNAKRLTDKQQLEALDIEDIIKKIRETRSH